MQIACRSSLKASDRFELLVLPFWEGQIAAADLRPWMSKLTHALKSGDFTGKMGETLLLYPEEGRILLLGLGKIGDTKEEELRRALSLAVRTAQGKKIKTIHLIVPTIAREQETFLRAVAEGILLTNYGFTGLKGDSLKDNPLVLLEKVTFIGIDEEAELKEWQKIVRGVHLVRDLVNANADDATPVMIADTVRSWEKGKLKATILDKKQLEKEKMGLLLAVNQGSAREPYLALLSYQGNPRGKEHIVLIGKGITYDTGGLSLKPTESMLHMKCDMSGAATVLTAVKMAAELNLKVNVTAVAPLTENAIDAKSYKIGDVYRCMSGKTVEITNTDAEGRLVLADAISYAIKKLDPTMMIDVASLTGGIVVALGEEMAGIFATNDELAKDLEISSEATGELVWRMPLNPDYKEMLKSEVADLINAPGRWASSMTAALFLREFCEDVPWAHIDFAGPCFLSKPKYYNTTQATGFGVRLLVDFLERKSPA